MTVNYLMLRLQFWVFGECGVPLHYHYYQVHSDPEESNQVVNYNYNCAQTND